MTNPVSFVNVDRASDGSWGEGERGHGDDLLSLQTSSFVFLHLAVLHQVPYNFQKQKHQNDFVYLYILIALYIHFYAFTRSDKRWSCLLMSIDLNL